MSFDEKGELVGGFDLTNWVTFPNQSFLRVKVGLMDPQAPPWKVFTINDEIITWHNAFNQVGFDSVKNGNIHKCTSTKSLKILPSLVSNVLESTYIL